VSAARPLTRLRATTRLPPSRNEISTRREGGRGEDRLISREWKSVINATCQSSACVSLLISLTSFHVARSSLRSPLSTSRRFIVSLIILLCAESARKE
jgi:hypothetical protein